MPEGHLPQLGILIHSREFQKHISVVNIDEAHFIHTAGISRYGLSTFWPAWGQLRELKVILPDSIPWHAISTTFPPHILKMIKLKILQSKHTFIQTTSNCPNTMYATHCVPSNLQDLHNYECFLTHPFNPATQPCVLIFFNNWTFTCTVADHLDSLLPPTLRRTGIVQFYHSLMSEDFLLKVHHDFTAIDGPCKVLCAMLGESVIGLFLSLCVRDLMNYYDVPKGVDFPDVQVVCNVGVPGNIVDLLQHAGHLGRCDGDKGLAVVFHKQWALEISLDEFKYGNLNDPDQPCTAILKPMSNMHDRAAFSCIGIVQEPKCLRKFFSLYLADFSLTGTTLTFHPGWEVGDWFLLSTWFLHRLLLQSPLDSRPWMWEPIIANWCLSSKSTLPQQYFSRDWWF